MRQAVRGMREAQQCTAQQHREEAVRERLGIRHSVGEAGTDGAPDPLNCSQCQLQCSGEPLGSVGPWADMSPLLSHDVD